MHYLLKFGYDGRKFSGYQRGNGARSVEDSILKVMLQYGISEGFSSAARTDRGVSAAGNVIFFRSEMGVEKIMGILNSKTRDMIFHSHAEVSPDFRVRYSSLKHYRYILHNCQVSVPRLDQILSLFKGEHDFTLFSRRDERTPVRVIEDISVDSVENRIEINVYGPNFVWNQIRSMVGFAMYYAKNGDQVTDPFSIHKKKWYVARPEPLVLMDISYKGITFTRAVKDKTVMIWDGAIQDLDTHSSVLRTIISVARE